MKELYQNLEILERSYDLSWRNREQAILSLQAAIPQLDISSQELKALIKTIRNPLLQQLQDKRSVIIREICKLIVICSRTFKNLFAVAAKDLVISMINLINSGNKLIAAYADRCCCDVLKHTTIRSLVPYVAERIQSHKNKDVRGKCAQLLIIVLSRWNTLTLDQHSDCIQYTILKSFNDASAEVRNKARESYWHFERHWPNKAIHILENIDSRTQQILYQMLNSREEKSIETSDESSPYTAIQEEEKADTFDCQSACDIAMVTEEQIRDLKFQELGKFEDKYLANNIRNSESDTSMEETDKENAERVSVVSDTGVKIDTLAVQSDVKNEACFKERIVAHRLHISRMLEILNDDIRLFQKFETFEDQDDMNSSQYYKSYVESLKASAILQEELTRNFLLSLI